VKPGDYHQFGIHRTPHVHAKVQASDTVLLTTQLFFPGEPLNDQDVFMKESLIMDVRASADGRLVASFDFILQRKERRGMS
jgi:protocatechuate 3,4-dioxygenase beta subunit